MATDSSKKKCTHCGTPNAADALFCSSCGKPAVKNATDPFVGRLISQRFRIDTQIAEGGMGQVYRARHIELQQNVAVKFLHRRFADDEEIAARFFNEARSACRVKHPLAVQIYDFGRLEDGTLFLVMEFVEGISLTRFIRRDGTLLPSMAVRFATQLCEALAAAHQVGVVHRDVKPDNIMIVESSSGHHTIKVLDFGIAKMLDDENSKGLTQTGMMFGTPEYMSPEQAGGKEVDGRSDIYSMGLVLYAMLAGHPPFLGQNKLQLLQRQIHEKHAPIERACRHSLPAGLAALIDDMLQKDPARRPQSMEAVLSRLEELRSSMPASNSDVRPAPRAPAAAAPAAAAAAPAREAKPAARGAILTHGRGAAPAPAQESFSFSDDDVGDDHTGGFELGDAPVGDSMSFGDTGGFELGNAPRNLRGARDDFQIGDTGTHTDGFEVELHTERSMPPLRESRTGLILGFAGGALVLALVIGVIYQLSRAGEALTAPPAPAEVALADGSGEGSGGGATEGSVALAVPAAMPSSAGAATAPSAATAPPAATAASAANAPSANVVRAAPAATAPSASTAAATAPAAAAPAAPAPAAAPVAAAPAPSAELEREARAALEALRRGDDATARTALTTLSGRDGAEQSTALGELRTVLGRMDAFVTAIEGHLTAGNCVRADENVVNLREQVSLTIAQRYYGRLDECRAAQRPQSADARTTQGSTRPAPSREPAPAPVPAPSGGGRVRPPAEL